MPALEELIPLYLTACTVEGKTDRTVQSYDETLRQFQGAVRELRAAGGWGSLRASPRLPLHGLGARARCERRYPAPPPA